MRAALIMHLNLILSELLVAAIMNSQGLKNAIILLCTNALVRREVYGRYDDDFNVYSGNAEHGGCGRLTIDSSVVGESKHFQHNRNITPQLPSLNNSFEPSPPKF